MAMSQSVAEAKIGQPPFRLLKYDNYGYCVTPNPEPETPRVSGRILAIDGTDLRGKSDREITNLLRGAVGTSVGITVFDDGEVRTIKVIRVQRKPYGIPAVTDFSGLFQDCDHEIVVARKNSLGDWLAMQDLDVFAQAQNACVMDAAKNLPGDNSAVVAEIGAASVSVLEKLGRFLSADKQSVDEPDPSKALDQAIIQFAHTAHDLADFFEHTGGTDRAIKCYQQWLNNSSTATNGGNKLHLDETSSYCLYGSEIGRLMEKQGDIDKAIQAVQSHLQRFRALTVKEEQLIAEKIPLYHPTESDLETQLATLYLKKSNFAAAKESADSAVQLIESALGPNSATLRQPLAALAESLQASGSEPQADVVRTRASKLPSTESQSQVPASDLFALLKQARTESGAELKQDLAKLEDAYAERNGLISGARGTSFCALLETARDLSDRKLYSESNGVLEFLKHAADAEIRPVVSGLIELEKAINSAREGKTIPDPWACAIESFPLSSPAVAKSRRADLDNSTTLVGALNGEEVFRVMAVVYALAGHNDRAKMLIDRALAEMKAIELSGQFKSSADKAALARRKTFLLLDAGRIKAMTGDLVDAQTIGREAVTLCSSTVPAPRKEARNFNETYRLKLAQLALAIKEHGSSNLASEQLLVFAQSNLSKGASANVKLEPDTEPRYSSGHYALIDALLAQLFLEDNNLLEASRHATHSVEMVGSYSFATWKVAADVAYRSGNFDAAAHRYSEAEKNSVLIRAGDYWKTQKVECLQKAAESAAKAPNLNKVEAANIYIRMADTLDQGHSVEVLKYYEQAYDLTPDSDPRKHELLGRIAEKKGAIASTQSSRESNSEQNDTVSREAERISAITQLNLLKQSAKLAEAIKSPDARSQWQKVSLLEEEAGLLSEALADLKHSLSIGSPPYGQRALGSIEIFADDRLMRKLAENGRSADVEALLQKAAKAVNSSCGEQSPEAATQLVQLVVFYFDRNDQDKAFRSLHELLSLDLRAFEVGLGMYQRVSAQTTLEDYASALVTKGKGELAVQILQKILQAQRKIFEPDNERIALSLLTLAEVESAMNNTEDAKLHALEAARIFTLYEGVLHVEKSAGGRFENLWRKLAPDYEAKTFAVRQHGSINTGILRMLGDDKDAAQIEQFQRMPAGYVDPFKTSVSVDAKASPAAKLKLWQNEYAVMRVVAPYSSSAGLEFRGADEDCARFKRLGKTLSKAATARAIIYEHVAGCSRRPPAGLRFVLPNTRLDCYKKRCQRNTLLSVKPKQHKKWLDRGIKVLAAKNAH